MLLRKAKYTKSQKEKIAEVMGEFKDGKLKSSDGSVVTDRKQAIAIALSQAGVEMKKSEGRVKGHTRRTKSGKTVMVKEHSSGRSAGAKFSESIQAGINMVSQEIRDLERDKAGTVDVRLKDRIGHEIHGKYMKLATLKGKQTYHRHMESLNNKGEKKIGNNTTLRKNGTDLQIILHQTPVVTIHDDGTFTLDTGGWATSTTKERINKYSPASIYQKHGEWFVHMVDEYGDDTSYPFKDGMKVNGHGDVIKA